MGEPMEQETSGGEARQRVTLSEEVKELTEPYLFNDKALARFLTQRLHRLFTQAMDTEHYPLSVTVTPPAAEAARCAWRYNQTLRAVLKMTWAGDKDHPLEWTFPYPWQGVFVLHQAEEERAALMSWRPYLLHRPGLWRLRRYGAERSAREESTRYMFLDGTYIPLDEKPGRAKKSVEAPMEEPTAASILEPEKKSTPRLKLLAELLEPSEGSELSFWCIGTPDQLKKSLQSQIDSIKTTYDDQDLAAQRLFTYTHFVLIHILQALFTSVLLKQPHAAHFRQVFSPSPAASPPAPPSAEEFWKTLRNDADLTSSWLPSVDRLRNQGRLLPFHPLNGIDALSQLTGLEKYGFQSRTIEQLPAHFRQNHPSYQGWICPVESPESKRVGISLHLARGVKTNLFGELMRSEPEEEKKPPADLALGYAASLVPFYAHNDGARAMMGAKNLKQAVTIRGAQAPAILTGAEAVIQKQLEPLQEMDWVPRIVAPGRDLLVAYLPFFGRNYEDAIVANRNLVENGELTWEYPETHSVYIRPGLDQPRLFTEKEMIGPEDWVAEFPTQSGSSLRVFSQAEGEGILRKVVYQAPKHPWLGGRLEWTIEYRRPLVVGDKLMARYGNKGVISQFRAPEQMPRLPNDPHLPECLRGKAVDLVLNPMGVISRMNLGQLLETHLGLLKRCGKQGSWDSPDAARAFKPIALEEIREAFAELSSGTEGVIDPYGRIRLEVPDGLGSSLTQHPVVVGWQHFVRLRHHPPLKVQVRSGGGRHRYSLQTGQPVAGRRNQGGQRLGEMELWALAAHQAHANLDAVLGYKSDPVKPRLDSPHGSSGNQPNSQTFLSIRDHLYALGIQLTANETGAYGLSWITDEELNTKGRRLAHGKEWRWVGVDRFKCARCDYILQNSLEATGRSRRADAPHPTLGDLWRALGLELAPMNPTENLPRPDSKDAPVILKVDWRLKPEGSLALRIERTQRQVKVTFQHAEKDYCAYKQWDQAAFELAPDSLGSLPMTCPGHANVRLQSPLGFRFQPEPGGLCDPEFVGKVDLGPPEAAPWGYIELPQALPFPCFPMESNWKLCRFEEEGLIPLRRLIPVLPLRYRYQPPEYPSLSSKDQLSRFYARLLEQSANSKGTEDLLRKTLGAISANSKAGVHRRLFGKMGLLRRHGLGRRVDFSGRFVIVPDPEMGWDQCGVPTSALITLFGDRIAGWERLKLSVLGAAQKIHEVPNALDRRDDPAVKALQEPKFWTDPSWLNRQIDLPTQRLAGEVVRAYLQEHDLWVLLNRQPSLHRYSLMAFHPRPLPPEDGKVLRLHPLVCKGFGADFDGDEMALHFPATDQEQTEAAQLAPTHPRHLLSVANSQPLAGFDQDFVLGHYWLSVSEEGRLSVQQNLAVKGCSTCKALSERPPPWASGHGREWLRHLCQDHPKESPERIPGWMRLCFGEATRRGISFGALELEKCREGLKRPEFGAPTNQAALSDEAKKWNDELDACTRDHLDQILNIVTDSQEKPSCPPGLGFASIARSGARGDKQVRQLIAGRGGLLPGLVAFPLDNEETCGRFLIKESLLEGMSPEVSFWAAMNARSSMIDKKLVTPKAGYLMRKLVLALWGWRISEIPDCGSKAEPRTLANCQRLDQSEICAPCYGQIAGLGWPPPEWPIGLLAAQSFGERGTQLSMQSFHTGQRAMSIEEVERLLEGGEGYEEYFEEPGNLHQSFIPFLREIDAYKSLDDRHLVLIWLAIHRCQAEKKSLSKVWRERRGAVSGLIGVGQLEHLVALGDGNLLRRKKMDRFVSEQNHYLEQHPRVRAETARGKVQAKIKDHGFSEWMRVDLEDRTLTLRYEEEKPAEESPDRSPLTRLLFGLPFEIGG